MKDLPANKAVTGEKIRRLDAVPRKDGKNLVRAVPHAVEDNRFFGGGEGFPQIRAAFRGRREKIVHFVTLS